MTTRDDGGPAFPRNTRKYQTHEGWKFDPAQSGMSLRDYFAAAALQGMLADHETNPTPERAASLAYEFADAMLAERAKGKP